SARNLLLLQQHRLASCHVIKKDRGRPYERLVPVAKLRRVEISIDLAERGVRRVGEPNVTRLRRTTLGAERHHSQHRQSALAIPCNEKALEEIEILERRVPLLRQKFFPLLAIGRRNRGTHQLELFCIPIGANVEESVAMIDVILLIVHARSDELELFLRRRTGQK